MRMTGVVGICQGCDLPSQVGGFSSGVGGGGGFPPGIPVSSITSDHRVNILASSRSSL